VKSYHDIVGDGGSQIVEQVEAQRARIADALCEVQQLVAIGSGKGGVGKSTLTMGLAGSLCRAGHPVAVLDADLNGPSQARLAGLDGAPLVPGPDGLLAMPRTDTGIGVVSSGTLVPDTEAVQFETVAEGDSHVWRATREFAFLGQLLASVRWGKLDFLLVDLPPGAERTFQYAEFLGCDTAFVLVTIPSELSQSVVSRSVAALAETANPVLGYVENMSGYYCDGCREVKPLFRASRVADFGIPCLGRVPFDPAMADGVGDGSSASRSIDEIAAVIVAGVGGAAKERGS
jgi:ATP-binding protein involved in chromosome partitioning